MLSLAALLASLALARPGALVARIALVPDTQNYVTTIDAGDDAVRAKLLDAMVNDIVAYHPDFVLQVGDLTDSTGGPDQNGAARLADDPNHYGQPQDAEWARIRQRMFDRLDAEGIPHFEVVGNHDSCVDFERWFPARDFLARPWGKDVDLRPKACGAGAVDTTHRQALFETPIGTICVVGAPFNQTDADWPWIVSHLGCGAGRPTILVQHAGTYGPIAAAAQAEKDALVMVSNGHYTCTGCVMSRQSVVSNAGLSLITTFTDWQETSFGAPGGANHTGLSWWSSLEIDPKANTSTILAHNPYLGGIHDSPTPSAYRNANDSVPLPYDWCAKFGGAACP